jgi:hypothetical protein
MPVLSRPCQRPEAENLEAGFNGPFLQVEVCG